MNGVFGVTMKDVRPLQPDVIGLGTMAANTTEHVRVLCASPHGAA